MHKERTPGIGTVGAIIVAGGSGTRMEGLDKLFTQVGDRPLLARAVAAFDECADVDRIVVVLSEANLEHGRAALEAEGFSKLTGVCTGGGRRQDSVMCGLRTLGEVEWVAVHDAARPLVRVETIVDAIVAAQQTGAAIPVVPLADTVKEIASDGSVTATLDRSRLRAVQTPQIFRRDLLLRAHTEITNDVTDDASMLEALGLPVQTFEGDRRNIKITTPDDLRLAEAYLA